MDLYAPVTALQGIGSARARQLKTLHIETLYDLLTYFPRAYEDRTKLVPIHLIEAGQPACFEATVVGGPHTSQIRKGLCLTKLTVGDRTGRVNLVYFNQPYTAEALQYGSTYIFYGTLVGDYLGFQIQNPIWEPADRPGRSTRCIVPIYSLTAGISNTILTKCIRQALDACLMQLPELLPEFILERHNLCTAEQAYRSIHQPENSEALKQAKRRLSFEEFFVFSAGLQLIRSENAQQRRSAYATCTADAFLRTLPYSPTAAQQRAISEIQKDLAAGRSMNRLLQGDVGSGKTMVAAAAAYFAIKNGHQTAFMAPTEILAEQHFRSLSALMNKLDISCALLTGSLPQKEKEQVKQKLAAGDIQLVVGTHALLTNNVAFHNLDMVITDEQHRFGVAQRSALMKKGSHPHLLVMSATPIPRTLALMIYGDLNVSVLNELPPGRQKVDTFLVGESMRPRINTFIRKHAEAGHQIYIVCPTVEESDLESLKSAQLWADTLQKMIFPDLRVGLLHGKMKSPEKENIMKAFADHALDILVATTVVEVGVDVPNATLMIIENADRFGLSQLHQLRGRVGRGSAKSYCILFSDNKTPETKDRLQTLCKTNDGFQIAEKDLKLRGPGDFFGSRQHGLPLFKAANLTEDLSILQEAKGAADSIIADANYLEKPSFQFLKQRLDQFFNSGGCILN